MKTSIVAFLSLATMLFTAMVPSSSTAYADGASNAVHKLIVVSPGLPKAFRETFDKELLESEAEWMLRAPEESESIVFDGEELSPVAEFEARKGLYQRRNTLRSEAIKAKNWLAQNPQRSDARLNVPGVIACLPSLGLKPGTHVIFVGSPLHTSTGDGPNMIWDMTDGYLPTGKLLVAPRHSSLYSTVGREKNLKGLLVSFVVPTSVKYVDDAHLQRTINHHALTAQLCGGKLIAFNHSFKVTATAANEGLSDALVSDVTVGNDSACMLRLNMDTGRKEVKEGTEDKSVSSKVDKDGNPEGEINDLGQGQKLQGKVLLLCLSTGDCRKSVLESPLAEHLSKTIATETLSELPNYSAFEAKIRSATQLWVWAGSEPGCLPQKHLDLVVSRFDAGQLNLFLMADNTPWTYGVEGILLKIGPGSTVSGNYGADRILDASSLENHAVFTGINSLYEGDTVSSPKGPRLQTLAKATDGNPLIALVKGDNSKRAIVSGGFTMFMEPYFHKTAGTKRFAANIAAYLAGINK